MNTNNDNQILIDIAHLYHDNDWTQERIASKFNMSRSQVSKCLTKAKKLGIIEVVIHDGDLRPHRELEVRIKEKFHLREVICIGSEVRDENKNSFAKAAGEFLSYKIIKSDSVVITAGSTNYTIASNYITSSPHRHVTFIPASGGLFQERWEIQANVICERIANNCGGNYMQLHVPIVVDSLEAKQILTKQHFVKNVFDHAKKADLAIIGIGTSPVYHKLSEVYLNGIDINDDSIKNSLIGDIAYNYFDEKGKIIDCEWNRQLMALSLDDFKNIPEVVGIAYGKDKLPGIYTAAKYGLINTLITDKKTGKNLIAYKN
ncbi:MAG: sugar-binding domain-containing protein [Anaerostipes sp.]|nr:sugar-binding domain-containing protein [Anaerostipes sp.]